jgi:serine protease
VTIAPKSGAVDANGLGTYVLTLNRSALGVGIASFAQITVTTSTRSISIPITAERREATAAIGSYGPLYVFAFDADDPEFRVVGGTVVKSPVNGEYAYQFTVGTSTAAAPSKIVVFAGGDTDNDDRICNRGEACGAFPSLGNGTTVIQPRSALVSGINFSVTPFGGINASAAALRKTPSNK